MTQSMVDRCIQEYFYEFMVHILPCKLPPDARICRKRKTSHSMDESANSFLSAAIPCSPIVLNAPATTDDKEGGRNSNLNNSNNPLIRTLLGLKSDSRSGTPSPVSFASANQLLSSTLPHAKVPAYELPRIGRPPKLGRPRSKSTTTTVSDSKNHAGRTRSSSIQPSLVNHNTNNSNESSPNSLLSISQYCFLQPMPITPPKNPYEDPSQILDPKTLKCLQLH